MNYHITINLTTLDFISSAQLLKFAKEPLQIRNCADSRKGMAFWGHVVLRIMSFLFLVALRPLILRCLLFLILSISFTSPTIANDDLWLDDLEEITPVNISHMEQDLSEVSAGVTIITRDDIARRKFRDIYDALRTVPGMKIRKTSAPLQTVDHASGGTYLGRGLEIKLNGITQTTPTHSTAFLDFLVPIDSVERIEIVRGSNAAADGGSKSFKGSIDIITRSPEYHDPNHVTSRIDTDGRRKLFAYFNPGAAFGENRHALSISGNLYHEKGYHRYDPTNDETPPAQFEELNDDADTKNVFFQYLNTINAQSSLKVNAYFFDGDFIIAGRTFIPNTLPEFSDSSMVYQTFSSHYQHQFDKQRIDLWTGHQDWDWQQTFNVCGPTFMLSPEVKNFIRNNISLAPDFFTGNLQAIIDSPEFNSLPEQVLAQFPSVFFDTSNNGLILKPDQLGASCGFWPLSTKISRSTVRAQTTLPVTTNSKSVFGVEGARSGVDGVLHEEQEFYNSIQAYTHTQWHLNSFTFNFGTSAERYNGRDAISSELGVNYHLSETKTLRASFAKAKKMPDIADVNEGLGKLLLIVPEGAHGETEHFFYNGNELAKNTTPQVVYSREVGLLINANRNYNVDIRLFDDTYSNYTFYEIFLAQIPPTGSMDKQGIELQFNGALGKLRYGYTLHWHDSEATQLEEDYTSKGISAYFNTRLMNDYELAINTYLYSSEVKWVEGLSSNDSKIFEVLVTKPFTQYLETTFSARHDTSPNIARDNYPYYYTTDYDRINTVSVAMKLLL